MRKDVRCGEYFAKILRISEWSYEKGVENYRQIKNVSTSYWYTRKAYLILFSPGSSTKIFILNKLDSFSSVKPQSIQFVNFTRVKNWRLIHFPGLKPSPLGVVERCHR